MICPKCGKENTPDEVFCTQCGELLLTFSHSDENNTASAQSPEPTDAPSSPAVAQTQANSTNRSESASNSTRSSSKPQKSTKTKTKKRSAPAKNSRSKSKKSAPKRTKETKQPKQPKQPKERRPKQQGDTVVVNKTVKKGGCGCLSFVLAGILVLILAAVVAGGIFVYRYGYDNILAHFGYELTAVKDESSSADDSTFSSLPYDDTTSDTVSEDEEPAFSSEPAVSDVISAEE